MRIPDKKIIKILRQHEMRITETRKKILKKFLSLNRALAHIDLESFFKGSLDRVTIYRTLHTFEEKGVIHKVLDTNGVLKYALCDPESCDADKHEDHHMHFKCRVCGVTNCLNDTEIPELSMPKGYQREKTHILLEGVCSNCSD